jgi:hypothetical protein
MQNITGHQQELFEKIRAIDTIRNNPGLKNLFRAGFSLIILCAICLPVFPAGLSNAQGQSPYFARNALPQQSYFNTPSSLTPSFMVGDNNLLQFTASGHVLGFGRQSVYFAGIDHALRVDFNGGHPVQAVAEGTAGSSQGTTSLGKVSYSGVWDNIDINYSAVAGGIAESTYVVHPGGNPTAISLSYNTPVEIMQDGGLRFSFENGYMTETAPVAWQETDGKRLPVAVKFQLQNEKQVGFSLGNYNTSYAISIDPGYEWHTFYGTNSYAKGIAVDYCGNIYVTGSTC